MKTSLVEGAARFRTGPIPSVTSDPILKGASFGEERLLVYIAEVLSPPGTPLDESLDNQIFKRLLSLPLEVLRSPIDSTNCSLLQRLAAVAVRGLASEQLPAVVQSVREGAQIIIRGVIEGLTDTRGQVQFEQRQGEAAAIDSLLRTVAPGRWGDMAVRLAGGEPHGRFAVPQDADKRSPLCVDTAMWAALEARLNELTKLPQGPEGRKNPSPAVAMANVLSELSGQSYVPVLNSRRFYPLLLKKLSPSDEAPLLAKFSHDLGEITVLVTKIARVQGAEVEPALSPNFFGLADDGVSDSEMRVYLRWPLGVDEQTRNALAALPSCIVESNDPPIESVSFEDFVRSTEWIVASAANLNLACHGIQSELYLNRFLLSDELLWFPESGEPDLFRLIYRKDGITEEQLVRDLTSDPDAVLKIPGAIEKVLAMAPRLRGREDDRIVRALGSPNAERLVWPSDQGALVALLALVDAERMPRETIDALCQILKNTPVQLPITAAVLEAIRGSKLYNERLHRYLVSELVKSDPLPSEGLKLLLQEEDFGKSAAIKLLVHGKASVRRFAASFLAETEGDPAAKALGRRLMERRPGALGSYVDDKPTLIDVYLKTPWRLWTNGPSMSGITGWWQGRNP